MRRTTLRQSISRHWQRALWCSLLAVCFSAKGGAGETPTGPVNVAISGDYPPFCVRTGADENADAYTGFDLELLKRLSADLHWPAVATQPFAWPELSELLRNGRADLAICGITLRADRARDMTFTRPYLISGAVAVVPSQHAAQFPDLTAIDKTSVRIAVNAGGHLERVTRQRFTHASIATTQNNLELRSLLASGAADVVVSDIYETAHWPAVHVIGPFTHDRKALALPLDRLPLREQINAWLAAREADGWLASQRRKLGAGEGISPAQACAEAIASAVEMRFALMPLVGAVKRRDNLPITDAAQEAAVMARARQSATHLGVSTFATERLFAVLIEQAKRIQQDSAASEPSSTTLAGLRAAVAASSDALLPEVSRCDRVLQNNSDVVAQTLRRNLSGVLSVAEIDTLLSVLPPVARFEP